MPALPPVSAPFRTRVLFFALLATFANVERCLADFFASGCGTLADRFGVPAEAHHLSTSHVNRVSKKPNTGLIFI